MGYGLAYHCADGDGGPGDLRAIRGLAPVDWNCDGDMVDTQITGSVARGGEYSDDGILSSRDDWSSITYAGGARGGLETVGDQIDEQGLDYMAWRSEVKDYAVEVFDPGMIAVEPGIKKVRLVVTIRNVGERPDSYVVGAIGNGDWSPEVVDERVEVAADATEAVAVDVPLPELGVSADEIASLRLTVLSEAASWVGATRVVNIRTGEIGPLPSDAALAVDPPEPAAGETLRVSGDGFLPNSPVVLVSTAAG